MKISTSNNKVDFSPTVVDGMTALAGVITTQNYSTGIFKDNHRSNANFLEAETVALDFDDGLTIEEAEIAFADYKHIIGTTKSHRKSKGGQVCDRFRVILFLSEPITDARTYTATMINLMEEFPQADPQCKDAARFFFPCVEIYKSKEDGKLVDPVEPPDMPEPTTRALMHNGGKGKLARRTMNFIVFGAPYGRWNGELYFAAKDCQEQGYSIEETIEQLDPATRLELGNDGSFDDRDMATIESAFKDEPVHDPREPEDVPQSAFNFKTLKQLYSEEHTVHWLIEGLLEVGGISIMAGPPKLGKSTIVRQMCQSILTGQEFLDRKCNKGGVLYMALEEKESMLYEQFKKQGLPEDSKLRYHIGPPLSLNAQEEFAEIVLSERPALVVLDTLVMFANIQDSNNYQEVYGAITKYRNLARKSGSHIICVHHQNKSQDGGNTAVMGSTAFTGAVDAVLLFSGIKHRRFFTTSGRGLDNFTNDELYFDKKTQMYSTGGESDGEF